MNRVFLCFAGLWGLCSNALVGQEAALPFRAGTFTAGQMASTIELDVRGEWAVFLQPEGSEVVPTFYRYEGATWSEKDTPSLGFHNGTQVSGLDFSQSENEVAVFGENRVFSFLPNIFTPDTNDWSVSHPSRSIILEEDETVLEVELEGDTAAVVWMAGDLNPVFYLTLYERDAARFWLPKATHSIEGPGIFGPQPVRISSLSLLGDRVAIGSRVVNEIHIFERNEGGSSNWGLSKKLENSVTQPVSGDEIALTVDDTLLDVAWFIDEETFETRLMRYQRDEGGSNQWGMQNALRTYSGYREVEIDANSSELLLLVKELQGEETLLFGGLDVGSEVTLERMFAFSGGSWALLGQADLGRVRGDLSQAASSSLLGVFVSSPSDNYEGSGSWTVSIRAPSNLSLIQEISDEGSADGIESVIDYASGVVAVGNPLDNWAGTASGSVLLYRVQVGLGSSGQVMVPLGRIESPDPQAGERFGSAVSLASNDAHLLAIGASGRDGNRGRVYVYRISSLLSSFDSGEAELLKVIDSPSTDLDFFGTSVALALDVFGENAYLGVGAPFDDDAGSDAGAIYLFERVLGGSEGWGQRKKIPQPSFFDGKWFGWRATMLDTTGGQVLVATTVGSSSSSAGEVGVFGRNEGGTSNWGPEALIDAPAGSPSGFGESVGGKGEIFAVGAPGHPAGRAYVFKKLPIGWTLSKEAIGTVNDGTSFGTSVSVSDFQFSVGAPDINAGNGRLTVLGGDFLASQDWEVLFTRSGSTSEALGSGVASHGIYTAVIEGREIDVERAGEYEIWAKSQGFGDTDEWFPSQNTDHDRHGNLLEFALGTDPRSSASEGGFEVFPDSYTDLGGTYPSMAWREPEVSYSRLLLGYFTEGSEDLDDWESQLSEMDFEDGNRVLHYPLDPTATKAFYRLTPYYPTTLHERLN